MKYDFEFIVQRKRTGVKKEQIKIDASCYNAAMYANGMTYTGAVNQLEMDQDVVTYAILHFKEYDENGTLVRNQKCNDEKDFIPWEIPCEEEDEK